MPPTWNQPLLWRSRMPSRLSPCRLSSIRRRRSSLLSALTAVSDAIFVFSFVVEGELRNATARPAKVYPTAPIASDKTDYDAGFRTTLGAVKAAIPLDEPQDALFDRCFRFESDVFRQSPDV